MQTSRRHSIPTRMIITMSNAVEPYKSGFFDLTHKLTVEKHGHTALITINHPPANTWDRESLTSSSLPMATAPAHGRWRSVSAKPSRPFGAFVGYP